MAPKRGREDTTVDGRDSKKLKLEGGIEVIENTEDAVKALQRSLSEVKNHLSAGAAGEKAKTEEYRKQLSARDKEIEKLKSRLDASEKKAADKTAKRRTAVLELKEEAKKDKQLATRDKEIGALKAKLEASKEKAAAEALERAIAVKGFNDAQKTKLRRVETEKRDIQRKCAEHAEKAKM